jgi:hypothetical protein
VASGYSPGGMKAPRHAHWLVVPALVTGMTLGPVAQTRAQAPARTPPAKEAPEAETEPEPDEAAPEDETAPEDAPKDGDAGKAPAPKGKDGKAPKGDAGAAPKGDAGKTPKGDAGAAPKGASGTPPAVEGEPTTAEPATEGEPTTAEPTPEPEPEPEPEPAVTVQPQPVGPSLATTKLSIGASSNEVVVDPRRLRSDERVLFRAGLLSLGVAAVAVVPMVIGLQQAYVAEQEGMVQRERTMNGLGIGAGIAAGTYAITGVVLLALGSRRRTERRAAVAPVVGPGQVGAMLRARF